jgi:hypothetical protein
MTEAAASAVVGGATARPHGCRASRAVPPADPREISEFVGKFNLRRISKGLYIPRCPNYAEEAAAPVTRTA